VHVIATVLGQPEGAPEYDVPEHGGEVPDEAVLFPVLESSAAISSSITVTVPTKSWKDGLEQVTVKLCCGIAVLTDGARTMFWMFTVPPPVQSDGVLSFTSTSTLAGPVKVPELLWTVPSTVTVNGEPAAAVPGVPTVAEVAFGS